MYNVFIYVPSNAFYFFMYIQSVQEMLIQTLSSGYKGKTKEISTNKHLYGNASFSISPPLNNFFFNNYIFESIKISS